jgi:RHS repeat-associated protein
VFDAPSRGQLLWCEHEAIFLKAGGAIDQSERIKLGDTLFHNGPIGLSATSSAGVDTGFNREPEGTLNSMARDGKAYYYLSDALGSVAAIADETGTKVDSYSYSPRGVTRSASSEKIAQPYRFAGGYQDPTGMYHFAARYYDPNIGRFTQRDPSGQEQDPYLYAEGDPVNRIDRQGCSVSQMCWMSPRRSSPLRQGAWLVLGLWASRESSPPRQDSSGLQGRRLQVGLHVQTARALH